MTIIRTPGDRGAASSGPSIEELEQAFSVYFDEIERCRRAETYWALLHVVVSLPDICAALESENGWATEKKYVDWCDRYYETDVISAEDYRDIRNLVLHQGRTVTRQGRFYKFTRPTPRGARVHRCVWGDGDIIVLDVGELANDMLRGIRAWFADLQGPAAVARLANVAKHLPSLVTVKEQEMPGITGVKFNVTHTSTGAAPPRPLS